MLYKYIKLDPIYIEGPLINSDIYICLSIWRQKGEFSNTLSRRTNIGVGGGKRSKLVMKMMTRMCFSHHVYNLEMSIWEDNGVGGGGHWEHECQRCRKCTGQHDIEWIEADRLSLGKKRSTGDGFDTQKCTEAFWQNINCVCPCQNSFLSKML